MRPNGQGQRSRGLWEQEAGKWRDAVAGWVNVLGMLLGEWQAGRSREVGTKSI